jgi:hypothetical protein
MSFALSYHPDVPALLTQPRLFIGPELPGYVSDEGNVLLPMTLDGRMTDTGVRSGDERGMDRYLRRHEDRFVCESPRLQIYSSRGFYETSVLPGWLRSVTDWIDEDWRRYNAVLADHPFQRTVLQTVKGQMSSLKHLFSACLYLGHDGSRDSRSFLYPHDLALYGEPVDVRHDNLYPTLSFLETFCLTHEQIRAGVAEKIVVERGSRGATIHDVESLRETHGTFVQFALRQGAVVGFLRESIRPTITAVEDEDGNVDPTALQGARVHESYLTLQCELVQRTSVFLGCLLLIHYQIDGPMMEALIRRLAAADRIGTLASREHRQFVLESEMFDLGHSLSRNDQGFEGNCLLQALTAVSRMV